MTMTSYPIMMTLMTFYDEESLPGQCEQLHTVCKTTAALKKKISWMNHIAITTPINQAYTTETPIILCGKAQPPPVGRGIAVTTGIN